MKIEWVLTGEGEFASIAEFRGKHPDVRITAIDDICLIGECESCGALILDGDDYISDVDAVYVCEECK